MSNESNYLLLYDLAIGQKPYQPNSSWGPDKTFKLFEILTSPKKTFIPDPILQQKPKFKPDNF